LGPERLSTGASIRSTFSSKFLAALGLGAAGGTGPESRGRPAGWPSFLLLPVKGRLAGLPLQLFLLPGAGCSCQIGAGDCRARWPRFLVADPIEKGAVVAGRHQGHIPAHQVTFQATGWFPIQVGWLGSSSGQQVRVCKQDLAQGDAHLPAALE